jgi:hypothetical protein
MKLGSILALVSPFAIAATAAADTSFLRKDTNGSGLTGRGKVDYGDESGYAGVVIVMNGVTSQDGASNDIVSNCLVNAFNTVHKKFNDDYELENAIVVQSFVVPSPSSIITDENDEPAGDVRAAPSKKKGGFYFWLETGYHCRLCNPDRDSSSYLSQGADFFESFAAKKNGNMHKALKKEFRQELLASGDEVFANIEGCEISFIRPAAAAVVTTTTTAASATSSAFDSSDEEDGMARLTTVGRHQEGLVTVMAAVTKE